MEKRDVIGRYNLPKVVLFCKRCTVSNQRPRITFDEEGVCSACKHAEYKQRYVDWDHREQELVALCNRHGKSNGDYDVIVPRSGGKDGGFVAHQLKYKYGMNPLAVTWAPLKPTEVGRRNLDAFIAPGFDHISFWDQATSTKSNSRNFCEWPGNQATYCASRDRLSRWRPALHRCGIR